MTPASHWSSIGERTSFWGILTLYWIYRLLGRWPFRLCQAPVVLYYWLMSPLARQASMQYLQHLETATGALGRAPGRWQTLRHLWSFTETVLDKLLAISNAYPIQKVHFEGLERINEQVARGQGAIVITAHMGCLELCRALAQRHPGFHLNVLVHTAHAERFNRLLRKLNPDLALTLIQIADITPALAQQLANKIAAGEFVTITGDRVPPRRERITRVPFLGQDAPLPIGPYVLASLLRCPLLFLACIREQKQHVLHFELLAERIELPRSNRDAILAQHATQFAQCMTTMLQRAPYEWFNFFFFWDQA